MAPRSTSKLRLAVKRASHVYNILYQRYARGCKIFFARFRTILQEVFGQFDRVTKCSAIRSIDILNFLYYSKDRKRARYQQTVTPSSCHCKMTASFAGLGGHFAYVRNNPANNTTKIAMRSIFAYTAFTSFPFGMRQTSPPFPQGMEDTTAYRENRQRAEK